MREQKEWNSLYDAIKAMNNTCSCLVLRNFEDMSNEKYYMEGHDDIDFLCENQEKVVRVLDARKNVYWGSPDHYIVRITGNDVKFGLRYIGDGYYDIKWQKKMLNNKTLYKNAFYVMSHEDYFYSLLYHALLQKQKLSADYHDRLQMMGKEIGVQLIQDVDYLECLIRYLETNNYTVEYPLDPTVPIHYDDIPESLKGSSTKWKINKIFFKPRRIVHRFSIKIKGRSNHG